MVHDLQWLRIGYQSASLSISKRTFSFEHNTFIDVRHSIGIIRESPMALATATEPSFAAAQYTQLSFAKAGSHVSAKNTEPGRKCTLCTGLRDLPGIKAGSV